MSDNNLRTRIISAIAKADQDWCSDNNLHEDMADAVIRELGLTKAARPDDCRFFRYPPGDRYITDWLTDA